MIKYVPPHRRRNTTINSDNISNHATLRMDQRDINDKVLKEVVNEGIIEEDKDTVSYRTEETFCVTTPAGRVVTVMHNHRNTEFDLLNSTKDKEKKLLVQVAQNNDFAMCELADFYLDRRFNNFNVKKAYELFLRAATECKNSHAMCKLADLHKGSLLGASNHQLYLKWMTKAADRGNKYATAIMGEHFMTKYKELSVRASKKEKEYIKYQAIKYLEKSIAKGSTRAMWHAGFIYQTGLFGEKDLSKAINIFVKAAKRGSPSSLTSLQNIIDIKDIDQNIIEDILDQISPIIAKQSSQIAVEIGLKQIDGELGANKEKASIRGLSMLEFAAKNRNEDALINLIDLYKEGTDFILKDHIKTAFWANKLRVLYEEASSKGNIDAKFELGNLWLGGDLGAIDHDKALEYFNDTVSSGDALYIYYVGILLTESDTKIRNYEKGQELINRAIDIWKQRVQQGDDIEAATNIAGIYYDGDLGKKDYMRAIEWLTIVANLGDRSAKYYLAKIYLVKLAEKNVGMAIDYIEQIIKDGPGEINLIKKLSSLFPYLLKGDNAIEGFNWLIKTLLQSEKEINSLPKYNFVRQYLTKKYLEICLSLKKGEEITDYISTAKWLSLVSYAGSESAIKLLVKLYSTVGLEDKLTIKNWVELSDEIISTSFICKKLIRIADYLTSDKDTSTEEIIEEFNLLDTHFNNFDESQEDNIVDVTGENSADSGENLK